MKKMRNLMKAIKIIGIKNTKKIISRIIIIGTKIKKIIDIVIIITMRIMIPMIIVIIIISIKEKILDL